jgi:hypothetical protein
MGEPTDGVGRSLADILREAGAEHDARAARRRRASDPGPREAPGSGAHPASGETAGQVYYGRRKTDVVLPDALAPGRAGDPSTAAIPGMRPSRKPGVPSPSGSGVFPRSGAPTDAREGNWVEDDRVAEPPRRRASDHPSPRPWDGVDRRGTGAPDRRAGGEQRRRADDGVGRRADDGPWRRAGDDTSRTAAVGYDRRGADAPARRASDRAPDSDGTGRQRAVDGTGRQRAADDTGRQHAVDGTGRQRAVEGTGRQRAVEDTGWQRAVEDDAATAPAGGALAWLRFVGELVFAAAVGTGVYFAFSVLWELLPYVAAVAAPLAVTGLVTGVGMWRARQGRGPVGTPLLAVLLFAATLLVIVPAAGLLAGP